MTYKIGKEPDSGSIAPGQARYRSILVIGRNLLSINEFFVDCTGFQRWLHTQSRRQYGSTARVALHGFSNAAKLDVTLHKLAVYALGQIVLVENSVKVVHGALSFPNLLPEACNVPRGTYIAISQPLTQRLAPRFICFASEKRTSIEIEKSLAECLDRRLVDVVALTTPGLVDQFRKLLDCPGIGPYIASV